MRLLELIALLRDGTMVISDWRPAKPPISGTVTLYAYDASKAEQLDFGRMLHGPADFIIGYAKVDLASNTPDGTVLIAPFKH